MGFTITSRMIDAIDMDSLLAAARAVAVRAHSPYSEIRVGAALLASDGSVHVGCNVENASYGLTLCAERSAVVGAVAAGVHTFKAVAIFTSLAEPLMPCGACRQVLSEFSPDMVVVVEGAGGGRVEGTLAELLPGRMGPSDLPSSPGAADQA